MILFVILGLLSSSLTLSGGSCGEKMYSCSKIGNCIPFSWMCDGEQDCFHGDDEIGCSSDCPVNSMRCSNTSHCIQNTWRCDGEEDCADGSDEVDCEGTVHCWEEDNHFSCGVRKPCIALELICDGHWDCPDGEDEDREFCSNRTCKETEFKCETDAYCVNKKWVCDGSLDCTDGSDEKNCVYDECGPNQFTCFYESPRCVDIGVTCDGVEDCGDGSDEVQCASPDDRCPEGERMCDIEKKCIPASYFCDGKADCPGDTDENNCTVISCGKDEFQCLESKACLPNWMVCNGNTECSDNSDEKNCGPTPAVHVCDEEEEFNCTGSTNSTCIPKHQLCDGHADCPNSRDENEDMCFNRTTLCSEPCKHGQCVVIDEKPKCVCNNGYEWSAKSNSCKDINECLDLNTCAQNCTNTNGGFKCSCHVGYELDGLNHKICRATEGEPLLMFVSGKELRYLQLRNHVYEPLIKIGGQMKAFDLDIRLGDMFISDYISGSIYSINHLKSPDNPRLVWKGFEPRTVEGMTYDWIFNNLYVVTHHRIDMLHLPSKSGNAYLRNVAKCSTGNNLLSAVIDPRREHGYLYWTVAGVNSSIVRSSLDGSVTSTFVGDDVLYPASLTIDFETNYLYWLDTKFYRIFRRSLKVKDNRIDHIFSSYTYIRQPLSIDVFESHLFWSVTSGRIHKLDVISQSHTLNRTISTLRDGLNHLSVVKIAHALKQPKEKNNVCINHSCSHICLPDPRNKDAHKCLCPDVVYGSGDVFELGNDGFTCLISHPLTHDKPHKSSISLIVMIILFLSLMAILAIMAIRRKIRRQNTKAMSFTNPVYRKQQTDDDFSIFKNQFLSATELLHVSETQSPREITTRSELV